MSTPPITTQPSSSSFLIRDILESDNKSDPKVYWKYGPRKTRTAFTEYQIQVLEKSFEQSKYSSYQDRMVLAEKLNLSDTQVKTWYQNRRTKWKRQTAAGLELLTDVNNLKEVSRLFKSDPNWMTNYGNGPPRPLPSSPPVLPFDLHRYQAAAAAGLPVPMPQSPLGYFTLNGNRLCPNFMFSSSSTVPGQQ